VLGIGIYYRETTFQQRRYLFELVEQIGNISKACRQAKVSREHYYHWKPRYDKDGIERLRHPKSHAVHNPKMIDPQIERRIIELRREHPSWGKKRIAQWIWMEHAWEKVVAINTVKNVLSRHGLWKNGKRGKIREEETKGDVFRINISPYGKTTPSPPMTQVYRHPCGIKKSGKRVGDVGTGAGKKKDEVALELGRLIIEKSKILSQKYNHD